MAVPVLVCLLAAAAVLVLLGPCVLSHGAWRIRHPRLALAAWHGALLAGAGCVLASLAWTLIEVTTAGPGSSASVPWIQPTALALFAYAGLGGVGGLAALALTHAEPRVEADRRAQAEFALLAARADARHECGLDVVVVPAEAPIALGIPGPLRLVVIASRLEQELSPAQLRAVVEHERAHLVQHHGLLNRFAELNRTCLAFLPASRGLERSTRLLIELIADDCAARRAGAVHLANALLKIGTLRNDEAMLLRAARIASRPPRGSLSSSRRLRRLSTA